jgi:hypothetical protein
VPTEIQYDASDLETHPLNNSSLNILAIFEGLCDLTEVGSTTRLTSIPMVDS